MDFVVLDIIILFGGVQALSLCFYLVFSKTENKYAHRFFILFLFCISLYNMGYAALFMNLEIGSLNMGMHPIPYKYLIGPALFGYIVYCLHEKTKPLKKIIWILVLPAILYAALRSYWLFMIMSGRNTFIIKDAYDLGFFTINEVIYLSLNLILGVEALKKTKDLQSQAGPSFGAKKNWSWLKTLSRTFLGLTTIHLLLILASIVVLGQHDRIFYYPTLIINSLFVYWIGFVGFTRSNILFFGPLVKRKPAPHAQNKLRRVLEKAMEEDKIFKNPKLTSQQLASKLDLPMHELTRFLNEQLGYNFSQYLNKYRTEEAIRLMRTELSGKYTLEALALEAGFNSKSSFYKIFKEQTGKTPSTFIKSLDQ